MWPLRLRSTHADTSSSSRRTVARGWPSSGRAGAAARGADEPARVLEAQLHRHRLARVRPPRVAHRDRRQRPPRAHHRRLLLGLRRRQLAVVGVQVLGRRLDDAARAEVVVLQAAAGRAALAELAGRGQLERHVDDGATSSSGACAGCRRRERVAAIVVVAVSEAVERLERATRCCCHCSRNVLVFAGRGVHSSVCVQRVASASSVLFEPSEPGVAKAAVVRERASVGRCAAGRRALLPRARRRGVSARRARARVVVPDTAPPFFHHGQHEQQPRHPDRPGRRVLGRRDLRQGLPAPSFDERDGDRRRSRSCSSGKEHSPCTGPRRTRAGPERIGGRPHGTTTPTAIAPLWPSTCRSARSPTAWCAPATTSFHSVRRSRPGYRR